MTKLYNFYEYSKIKYLHNYNGIRNIGNTCYMNTILQCLRNNLDLSNYFLTKKFKENLLEKQHSFFTIAFYHLLKDIWKTEENKKNVVVNPVEFYKQFQKTSQKLNRDVFIGFNQNDAEEFLMFVFDTIHESLQYKNFSLSIYGPVENQSDKIQKMFFEYLNKHLQIEGMSIIKSLYLGFQMSTITNSYNNYSSTNFEPFLYINLEIPNNSKTLHECLENYCKKDVLENYKDSESGHEYPNNTIYHKQVKFISLPNYLIIVLKRFKHLAYNHGSTLVKNNDLIKFPFVLNMNSYTVGYINNDNYIYDLQSVAYHTGGLHGGHYYATAKFKNKWRIFNDQTTGHIKVENEEQIINPDAYILFYKLIKQ